MQNPQLPIFLVGGEGRGYSWEFLARFSKSELYFRPKKVIFDTCSQTWPLKSDLAFKKFNVIITKIRTPTKKNIS